MPREVPVDPEMLELLLHREEGGSSEIDRDRILDAIETLPRRLQDAVNALFWEGLSIREYAVRAGINRNLAQERLDQAVYRLWKVLR